MIVSTDHLKGTSNWAEDYFSITGGLGLVFQPDLTSKPSVGTFRGESRNLRDQLEEIFRRDWNSELTEKFE